MNENTAKRDESGHAGQNTTVLYKLRIMTPTSMTV